MAPTDTLITGLADDARRLRFAQVPADWSWMFTALDANGAVV